MNTTQQALHIFRKDVREFRMEAAVVVALSALLVLTGVSTWESIQEFGRDPLGDTGPLTVLLPLAWCLLIARVIHAEALPGDRHFWLTRPYSRAGLLLSKGMFIAAFINVPLLIAQAAILYLDGFPLSSYWGGWIWNQLLITAVIVLPAATAAALTRNLAQFLPAAIVAGVLIIPFQDTHIQPRWFGALLGIGIAGAIGGTILALQYRRRRAVRHALMTLAAAAVVIVMYLAFPRSGAFAIQSTLIGHADNTFMLKLGPPEAAEPDGTTPNRYRQLLKLPIVPSGVAPRNVEIASPQISFRTLSGVIVRSGSRIVATPTGFSHGVSVDRNFYEAAKNSPVTVRAEYVVTVFGNEQGAELPLDGSPVMIDGLGQCGTTPNYDRRMILCRSPFHEWKSFVSDRVVQDRSFRMVPPLTIHPLGDRRFELTGEGAAELAPQTAERPVKLAVREPIGFFRYQLEASNVKLSDYAVAEPRE